MSPKLLSVDIVKSHEVKAFLAVERKVGDLKREGKKKHIGYCQWYITLTTCVVSLSEAISDRLLIKWSMVNH